jgi:hypothetical protein
MIQLPYYYEREVKREEEAKEVAKIGVTAAIIFVIWSLIGLAAFVMSIVCFGRSGTTGQHVVGLLLAMFFGPFYWIFYGVSPDYCNKISAPMIPRFGGKRK